MWTKNRMSSNVVFNVEYWIDLQRFVSKLSCITLRYTPSKQLLIQLIPKPVIVEVQNVTISSNIVSSFDRPSNWDTKSVNEHKIQGHVSTRVTNLCNDKIYNMSNHYITIQHHHDHTEGTVQWPLFIAIVLIASQGWYQRS